METDELQCYTSQALEDAIGQLHGIEASVRRRLLAFVVAYDNKGSWRADGASSMVAWLSYRLSLTPGSAAEMIEVAHALENLPHIATAFEGGALSWDQLRHLVRIATPESDASLAERAPGWSAAELERAAKRLQATRRRKADDEHDRRFLALRNDAVTGATHIRGRLPADQGAIVKKAIERLAEQIPARSDGTYEPYDARCADALVELASARIASDSDADRATVVVHVDQAVLMDGEGVAELDDGAAIMAETARRLCCDARIQTVLNGDDGRPVGVGRALRNPPPWLYRQIRHRDSTCRFPGCTTRRGVNAHHIKHWPKGGATDLDNLVLLCRYHHHLVHEGGWSVRGHPAHDLTFVRPDGSTLAAGTPRLRSEVRERLFLESSVA